MCFLKRLKYGRIKLRNEARRDQQSCYEIYLHHFLYTHDSSSDDDDEKLFFFLIFNN